MENNVLMTIKPHHLWNIRIGKKRFELRKTFPQLVDLPFKVFCCESNSGGKVIAEFTCSNVAEISPKWPDEKLQAYADAACVNLWEMKEYMSEKPIYGWWVADVIDYTREQGYKVKHISDYGVNRPPQSWCYAKAGVYKAVQWRD